jgi:hypothetical protein
MVRAGVCAGRVSDMKEVLRNFFEKKKKKKNRGK